MGVEIVTLHSTWSNTGTGNLSRPKSDVGFHEKKTMRAAKDCIQANLYDTTYQIKGVPLQKVVTFNYRQRNGFKWFAPP